MTKTNNKKAIRALPALRASLIWFKRETIRAIKRNAESVTSPKLRAVLASKASKVSKTDLADLRSSYEAQRVNEIIRARRAELSSVVPSIVWMSV